LASRDPAVALAARRTLTSMLDDDSRRVVSTVQAALAEAERIEDERADAGRPERGDHLEVDRVEQERVEPTTVKVESAIPPNGRAPVERADASLERRPSASWFVRHLRLSLTTFAIAIAVVIALAVALTQHHAGGGTQPPNAGLPQGIPARAGCKSWGRTKLAQDSDAVEQYHCNATAAYGGSIHVVYPSLDYLRYSNAQNAREGATGGPQYLVSHERYTYCATKFAYSRGLAKCVKKQGGLEIFWNDDNSTILGDTTFDPGTTEADALKAWRTIL
jgi:hypothetical protein